MALLLKGKLTQKLAEAPHRGPNSGCISSRHAATIGAVPLDDGLGSLVTKKTLLGWLALFGNFYHRSSSKLVLAAGLSSRHHLVTWLWVKKKMRTRMNGPNFMVFWGSTMFDSRLLGIKTSKKNKIDLGAWTWATRSQPLTPCSPKASKTSTSSAMLILNPLSQLMRIHGKQNHRLSFDLELRLETFEISYLSEHHSLLGSHLRPSAT